MADYKAEPIGEIKDLGKIYKVDAPLHKQISAFNDAGIDYPFLVTPEETCMIRIADLSTDWTRTCMAPVGVKGEAPILYRVSPLMSPLMAESAVDSHVHNEYSMFKREIYEIAKEHANQDSGKEPEDRRAFILSSNEDYELTPEMDDTKFILRKPMQEYFKKFNHKIIKLLNLPTNNIPKNKCVINALGFSRPDDGSLLGCWLRDLLSKSRAFGVLRKSAEGTSQNFGYSLTNVKDAIAIATPKTLKNLGIPRITEIVLGPLEQNILEILRNQ